MHESTRRIRATGSTRETRDGPPTYEITDRAPLMDGLAEVRIMADDPAVAQRVAQLLRRAFRCDEQRSYPAGVDGLGTLLHLTVDTGHVAAARATESLPWLTTSHTQAQRAHADEPG